MSTITKISLTMTVDGQDYTRSIDLQDLPNDDKQVISKAIELLTIGLRRTLESKDTILADASIGVISGGSHES